MELSIPLPPGPDRIGITGPQNRNLRILRETLDVALSEQGDQLRISGDATDVSAAVQVLEKLTQAAKRKQTLSRDDLLEWITDIRTQRRMGRGGASVVTTDPPRGNALDVYIQGKIIRPATERQQHYVNNILKRDMVFCTGPAGCGKTYLAVAVAVSLLKRGHIRKLILARPAVEAGERIGFLPGTLQEKVNPYLRPLLDALGDMMPFEQVERFMANDIIEVVPLAFMRGRTLNDACIILDEAQNTTAAQMLMFLTRLGQDAKMIITGDTTQIDLPDPRQSGLVEAVHRLRRIKEVGMVTLDERDIVRHALVQRVLEAWNPEDARHKPSPTDFTSDTDKGDL